DSATEYSFKYSVAPEILTGDAAQSKYQTIESFRPLASLTKQPSGSKWMITGVMSAIASSQEHGLEKGDVIHLTNAGKWDAIPNSNYNGNWTVDAVPDSTHFQFLLDTDPGLDSSSSEFASGYFGRLWQVKRVVVENNVIELAVRKGASGARRSIGIFMYGYNL